MTTFDYFYKLKEAFIPLQYQQNAHSCFYFLKTFKPPINKLILLTHKQDCNEFVNYYLHKNKLEIIHFKDHNTIVLNFSYDQVKQNFNFLFNPFQNPINQTFLSL